MFSWLKIHDSRHKKGLNGKRNYRWRAAAFIRFLVFPMRRLFENHISYSATALTGAVRRRWSNHNDFSEQKIVTVLGKLTNNVHIFEGCFLRGQVGSNGFEDFNGSIVESWILLVRLPKNLRIFRFQKSLIGQSSSKCPGSRSRTVNHWEKLRWIIGENYVK